METRVRHFPAVPVNVWGNQTDKPIPEHWEVQWSDGLLGWWTRSEHKSKASALAAEAALHLARQFGGDN